MTAVQRQNVSGHAHLRFVRSALNSLGRAEYEFINTLLVVKVLKALYEDGNEWFLSTSKDGALLVPEAAYTWRSVKKTSKGDSLEEQLMKRLPGVFTYKGGVSPNIHTLSVPDFESTQSVASLNKKVDVWAKGAYSPVSILARMEGYASLMSDAAKEITFVVSMAICSWKMGHPVDVILGTKGNFGPIHACLAYWQNRCKSDPQFDAMNSYSEPTGWFQFILPQRNAVVNSPKMKAYCISKPRELAVSICYLAADLPKKTEKTESDPDWDSWSMSSFPTDLGPKFIVHKSIFGPYYFTRDKSMASFFRKLSATPDERPADMYVYQFGSSCDFLGVVSSLPNLQSAGATNNGKEILLNYETLKCYSTRESWYRRVFLSNQILLRTPWKPKSQFNARVNLLIFTKGRVSFTENVWVDEEVNIYSSQTFVTPTSRIPFSGMKSSSSNSGEMSKTTSNSVPTTTVSAFVPTSTTAVGRIPFSSKVEKEKEKEDESNKVEGDDGDGNDESGDSESVEDDETGVENAEDEVPQDDSPPVVMGFDINALDDH